MTRTAVNYPVYTWRCDVCQLDYGPISKFMSTLPKADEMRSEGWHVAKLWGDVCPRCLKSGVVPADVDRDALSASHDTEEQ